MTRSANLDRELLRRLYLDESRSTGEIARQLGVSSRTVCEWLRRHDIPIRPAKKLPGVRMSAEGRAKLSEARKGSKNHRYGKKIGDETRAKIAAKARGRVLSPETRQRMREAQLGERNHFYGKRHAPEVARRFQGSANPQWGKSPVLVQVWWYERSDGEQVAMRSPWEVRAARAFDALGIVWQYEPRRFVLGRWTYMPDFYLPDIGVYYEIKGWFRESAAEKVRLMRELYPQHPLIVATEPVIVALERAAQRQEHL